MSTDVGSPVPMREVLNALSRRTSMSLARPGVSDTRAPWPLGLRKPRTPSSVRRDGHVASRTPLFLLRQVRCCGAASCRRFGGTRSTSNADCSASSEAGTGSQAHRAKEPGGKTAGAALRRAARASACPPSGPGARRRPDSPSSGVSAPLPPARPDPATPAIHRAKMCSRLAPRRPQTSGRFSVGGA